MKQAWLTEPILERKTKSKSKAKNKSYVWIIPVTMILSFLFMFYLMFKEEGYFGGQIESKVYKDDNATIICPSGYCWETSVYYRGDCLKIWFVNLPDATDSVKKERIAWAKDLLRKAKSNP